MHSRGPQRGVEGVPAAGRSRGLPTPIPAQLPTSGRSLPLGASVCPSVRQSPRSCLQRIPEAEFETALTEESPAWSGTSSPGRQNERRVSGPSGGRARPAACSGTPLPSAGQRAGSPGPSVPRTWYSASSSLDRRLPEPPIAASRAQLRQLVSGRRQLYHFRPRVASLPRPRGNRSWGHRPQAHPLLKGPRRS